MTALLSVSGDPNNHNLPQSGRLFILRAMAMLRKPSPISRHNLFCESEAYQFAFSLQNRTTI